MFFALFTALCSCGPKVYFEHEEEISGPWTYDHPVRFDYTVRDTSIAYDLLLNINHSSTFSTENLYVNVTTIFPDGKQTTSPVSLELASKNGDWEGKCRGDVCQITINLTTASYYKSAGVYALIFEQYARLDSLKGIFSLELQLIHSKK